MVPSLIKSFIAIVLVLCFWCTTSLARMSDLSSTYQDSTMENDTAAPLMIVDVVFLRPLGLLATIAGAVVYVVSLPVSLPTNSHERAAQKLVVDPAKYTFTRPLGQVPGFESR